MKTLEKNTLPKGRIVLHITDGERNQVIDIPNLIVNGMRTLIANAMAGIDAEQSRIAEISFGTGTTAAEATDEALENSVFSKTFDEITFPDVEKPWKPRFSFSLSKTEANGAIITEVGLFALAGLVSRRVLPGPFTKTNTMTVSGYWDIEF